MSSICLVFLRKLPPWFIRIVFTLWHFARDYDAEGSIPSARLSQFSHYMQRVICWKTKRLNPNDWAHTLEKGMGEYSEGVLYKDILEVADPLYFLSKIRGVLYLVQIQIPPGPR